MTIFNESTQGGIKISGSCRNKIIYNIRAKNGIKINGTRPCETIYNIRAKKGGVKIRGKYRIYMDMVLCPASVSKNLFSINQKTILEQIMSEGGYTLRLFKNDVELSINSKFNSFVEADFKGYSSKGLDGWTFNTKAGTCVGEAKHSILEWEYKSCTAVTVFGYYVANDEDQLLFSENFGPKTLKCSTLKIEVKTNLYSEDQ